MFKKANSIKLKLLIVFSIFFSQFTLAQDFIHEFGKYSAEEFQMQKYTKDTLAEAVVIYDIGKSYFSLSEDGSELLFERRTKIKILKKAGLKWAQISIPYYEENNKYEEIYEIKGNTYNLENGNVRKSILDNNNTYSEKYNEHWYDRKFAMPDVKEGSVIEISYKIRSPYLFNLRNWDFQWKIPVIYSEYTTKMIPFYEYTYVLQGASKFDEFKSYIDNGLTNRIGSSSYNDMVYFFVMKDVKAFRDESFITSYNDYIIKLDFQLAKIHHLNGGEVAIMTTWPQLSEELIDNDLFGKFLKNSRKKGKEITDTMLLAGKPSIEKIRIIDHFMKSNFNWNGFNDKFASKSVKEFLLEKKGNSAEINLFLTGLLNSAGIDAVPVILSTRSHGKIKLDYPFHHFFNYIVVKAQVDSLSILLDATEPLCAYNEIPTRCLNDKGLIVQKDKVEWVDLKSMSNSSTLYEFNLKINNSKDSIYENCKLISTGYDAIDYRSNFNSSYKDLKKSLLGINALSNDTLKPINLNQIEMPFEVDFDLKNPIDIIEDKIIISPFCNSTITENPLKQPFRNYPVDFVYKKANKFQSTIEIPNGYKLLSKPDNMSINNNEVKILYITDIKNNTIKIIGVYEFKKDQYGIFDYFALKEYYNKIVNKFNEKLIFVKE